MRENIVPSPTLIPNILIWICFVSLFHCSIQLTAQSSKMRLEVLNEVSTWLKKYDVPSAGIGVIENGKIKVVRVFGELKKGVTAKDIILYIISQISASGGTGYFIEYAGSAITSLSMEGRMTICNMSIE